METKKEFFTDKLVQATQKAAQEAVAIRHEASEELTKVRQEENEKLKQERTKTESLERQWEDAKADMAHLEQDLTPKPI